MDKINCLLIEPNKLPEEIVVKNELKALQNILHGSLEIVNQGDNEVVFLCCGYGKIKGMQLNRIVGNDIIAGSLLIVGNDKKNESFKSLTDKQKVKYKLLFGTSSIIKSKEKIKKLTQDQKDKER